jgi:hypothetical protein
VNRRELEDLARLRREVEDLRRDARRIPSTFPVDQDRSDIWRFLPTLGTKVLPPSGAYGVGLQSAQFTDITDIPNLASPGTLQDGVGICQNAKTGQLSILIHDPRSPVKHDLYDGDTLLCFSPVSLLITSSSPARYASCLVCRFRIG